MPNDSKLGRRGFIYGMSATAGLAATATVANVGTTGGPEGPTPQEGVADTTGARPGTDLPMTAQSEVQALFGPLAQGGTLEAWQVVSVEGLRFGAIAVVMQATDGTQFQVDVLRRDDAGINALAATDDFELFLSNRGDGSSETLEAHGLGLMALGRFLSTRETAVPGLLSHGERASRHPVGNYLVG